MATVFGVDLVQYAADDVELDREYISFHNDLDVEASYYPSMSSLQQIVSAVNAGRRTRRP